MKILMTLFLLMATFVGCTGILPLVGTAIDLYVTWKDGEAHAYFATDREVARSAVKRALANLGHNVTQEDRTSTDDYSITAGNNDRFHIKVVKVEPYITRVSIGINIMGDKPYAEFIYKELISELDAIEYTKMDRRFRWRKTTSSK